MDWKLKGENLILNFGSQQFSYKILRLNSTNFDVLVNTDYDGDGKVDKLEIYASKENCTTDDLTAKTKDSRSPGIKNLLQHLPALIFKYNNLIYRYFIYLKRTFPHVRIFDKIMG